MNSPPRSPIMAAQAQGIYQLAYLVEDLEQSAQHWAEMTGAGPFVLFDPFEFIEPIYKDAPCTVNVGIALGFSGELCIELIHQHDALPSIYSDWIRERGLGLHHVAILSEDFPKSLADYADQGLRPLFTGGFGADTHLAYLDTRLSLGCFLEIVEHTDFVRAALADMKDSHRNWDGRDVLRPFAG